METPHSFCDYGINKLLEMEPSEQRALQIMKLASEIASLQAALDDMTERCRTAERRGYEAAMKAVECPFGKEACPRHRQIERLGAGTHYDC